MSQMGALWQLYYKTTYADTNEVSELSVSVDIHLHDAVGNSSRDLFLRGTWTTMENKVSRDEDEINKLY